MTEGFFVAAGGAVEQIADTGKSRIGHDGQSERVSQSAAQRSSVRRPADPAERGSDLIQRRNCDQLSLDQLSLKRLAFREFLLELLGLS